MRRILVINPGATTTAVSLFEGERLVAENVVALEGIGPGRSMSVVEQYPLRLAEVRACLDEWEVAVTDLDAVVGRGGMLRPVVGGTYRVDRAMVDELLSPGPREHASNLGAPIASVLAAEAGAPAYIVDPVSVDEFDPIARISGLAGIERISQSHALNIKAAARAAAAQLGASYADTNLVVAHLGSGISVSAHRAGRMVDVNQGLDGTGPFAPERAGGLPIGDVMRLAYSGEYTYRELFRLVTRRAGLVSHLGTNDAREVERRIAAGDERAELVYRAMAYQIGKEIGLMATVLCGKVHAVVLTGNLAKSDLLVGWVRERVDWIAPVIVIPGQQEMLALAQGALRVLDGEELAREYPSGEPIRQ